MGSPPPNSSSPTPGPTPLKSSAPTPVAGVPQPFSDEHPVGPGQTGKIEVTFKTLNRHGLYEEPIIIDTNDPNAKQSTVFLRILLRNPVEVLPTLLFWQQGEPLAAKVIRITVTEGFNLKSLDVTCPNPSVQLRLDTIKPGTDYKLTVTPKTQPLKATISITPAIEGKPQHVIPALVRVS